MTMLSNSGVKVDAIVQQCEVQVEKEKDGAEEAQLLINRSADPSAWVVLKSGRLGLELPPHRSGKRVFLSTNGHTRLCEASAVPYYCPFCCCPLHTYRLRTRVSPSPHPYDPCLHTFKDPSVVLSAFCAQHGETASIISMWVTSKSGRPTNTSCTCLNIDGLSAGRYLKAPPDWAAPRYYDVLVANNAEQTLLPGGRLARRLSHGVVAAWMMPCGSIRCRHGNSSSTLRSISKTRASAGCKKWHNCDCVTSNSGTLPVWHNWRSTRLQTIKCKRDF